MIIWFFPQFFVFSSFFVLFVKKIIIILVNWHLFSQKIGDFTNWHLFSQKIGDFTNFLRKIYDEIQIDVYNDWNHLIFIQNSHENLKSQKSYIKFNIFFVFRSKIRSTSCVCCRFVKIGCNNNNWCDTVNSLHIFRHL